MRCRARWALHRVPLVGRFSVRSKLFPRIPQVKKEITATFMPPLEVSACHTLFPEVGAAPPGSEFLEEGAAGGGGAV